MVQRLKVIQQRARRSALPNSQCVSPLLSSVSSCRRRCLRLLRLFLAPRQLAVTLPNELDEVGQPDWLALVAVHTVSVVEVEYAVFQIPAREPSRRGMVAVHAQHAKWQARPLGDQADTAVIAHLGMRTPVVHQLQDLLVALPGPDVSLELRLVHVGDRRPS